MAPRVIKRPASPANKETLTSLKKMVTSWLEAENKPLKERVKRVEEDMKKHTHNLSLRRDCAFDNMETLTILKKMVTRLEAENKQLKESFKKVEEEMGKVKKRMDNLEIRLDCLFDLLLARDDRNDIGHSLFELLQRFVPTEVD